MTTLIFILASPPPPSLPNPLFSIYSVRWLCCSNFSLTVNYILKVGLVRVKIKISEALYFKLVIYITRIHNKMVPLLYSGNLELAVVQLKTVYPLWWCRPIERKDWVGCCPVCRCRWWHIGVLQGLVFATLSRDDRFGRGGSRRLDRRGCWKYSQRLRL